MSKFLIEANQSLEGVKSFANFLYRFEAWGIGGFKKNGTAIEVVMPSAQTLTFASSCIAMLAAEGVTAEVSLVTSASQLTTSYVM